MALGGTNFHLLSDVERATYNELKLTTTADVDAGTMEKKNDVVGVWVNDSSDTYDNVLVYEASKIKVPCVAITTGTLANYVQGKKVYFDETNAEVTAESSGNTLCGIIVDAGAVSGETLVIHLMGALGIVS